MTPETCVHIVDDNEALLRTWSFAFGAAGYATRIYASANALAEKAKDLRGCVVTDVRLLGLDGVQLVQLLRSQGFPGPIIVVTGFADVTVAVEAMRQGADDFLEKPFGSELLVNRMTQALAKREQLIQESEQRRQFERELCRLTQRQKEVLARIVEGKSNKVIARELGLSVRTVEGYRAEIMLKLGASNAAQVVRMWVAAGWTLPDSRSEAERDEP